MVDKNHLRDKRVAFRLGGVARAFTGNVQYVENDGFWLQAGDLSAELSKGQVWTGEFKKPVVFVPTAQLLWLITSDDQPG